MLARLLAAAALVALTALVPAPVVAGSPQAAPATPYLVRDGHTWTVHDGTTSIELPDSIVDNSHEMPPQYGVFRLLGRVDDGYVLVELVGPTAYDGGLTETDLHLLRPDGTATTFLALDGRAIAQRARLSDDGDAVWLFHDDRRANQDQSLLVGLDGRVTALPDRRRRVLDVPTATSVVYARAGRRAGVYRTDLARGRTELLSPGAGAAVADLHDDVLVRRTDDGSEVGRLSGAVRWSTPLAPVVADDRYVLLGGAPLELRRVRDGDLVTTFGVGRPEQAAWEDRTHVLLSDGTRVVRCGLDGTCTTALDLGEREGVSVTLAGATGPRWPGSPG